MVAVGPPKRAAATPTMPKKRLVSPHRNSLPVKVPLAYGPSCLTLLSRAARNWLYIVAVQPPKRSAAAATPHGSEWGKVHRTARRRQNCCHTVMLLDVLCPCALFSDALPLLSAGVGGYMCIWIYIYIIYLCNVCILKTISISVSIYIYII